MKMTLYPHNEEAYRKAMAAFETKDRVAVVHCTGSGKTYISAAVARHFHKVLFVAPVGFILNEHRKLTPDATFVTYHKLLCNYEDVGTGFDLIVLDEFHRCGAEGWGASVERLLNDNPQAKVFGLTATSKRYLEGRDMADELFKDSVVSTLDLKTAILDGIMLPPKYIIGCYTFNMVYSKYRRRIEESALNTDGKVRVMNTLDEVKLDWQRAMGVEKLLAKHLPLDTKRIIVFASNLEMLDVCKREVPAWFAKAGFTIYKTYDVNYENPSSVSEMEDFQKNGYEGIKVMFSVDMLNEGVHVPDVDAIIMMRKTISKNVYLQQIGRCMNAGVERQPVILDLVANVTRATDFQELREIKAAYDRKHRDAKGTNVVSFIIDDYTLDLQSFLDRVEEQIPHQFDLWHERKPLIDAHYAKYGHLPTMQEDETLHIYVMSFKGEPEATTPRAVRRYYAIQKYLMGLGFVPDVVNRNRWELFRSMCGDIEERGYYTTAERGRMVANKGNDADYSKAVDEFLASHHNEAFHSQKRLLEEVLPTIDWCGTRERFTEEQKRCHRLVKNIVSHKLVNTREDEYSILNGLLKKNPYLTRDEIAEERLRRFVTKYDRLPSLGNNATHEEMVLKALYYKLIYVGNEYAMAMRDRYAQKDGGDVVLDRLEAYIGKHHRYPDCKCKDKASMALARCLADYKGRFSDEQMKRYDDILKDVDTPEKRRIASDTYRQDMLERNIAFAKENGYLAPQSTDMGQYYSWHKNDEDFKAALGDYPTYGQYKKRHSELHAYEIVSAFVEKNHRLPVFTVTAETYTARMIRKHIWYQPIWDLCLEYEGTAKGAMILVIERQRELLSEVVK